MNLVRFLIRLRSKLEFCLLKLSIANLLRPIQYVNCPDFSSYIRN